MIWLFRQIRLIRDAVYAKDTPRQMALGFALGAMLGLCPKGNLLAIALATLLFGTRVSVATGLLSAAVFSLLSPLCDPLTHRMGVGLLTQPILVPLWSWLSRMPFAGWTAFNNTVVMGNLILGGILFYPIYRLTLPGITRYRQIMIERGKVVAAEHDDPPAVAEESVTCEPVVHSMAKACPNVEEHPARPTQRRNVA